MISSLCNRSWAIEPERRAALPMQMLGTAPARERRAAGHLTAERLLERPKVGPSQGGDGAGTLCSAELERLIEPTDCRVSVQRQVKG